MISINDLSKKLTVNSQLISSTIERVVDSGWLILGPQVKEFERAFAAYHNVSDCVGLANGTDALELALKALGVTHTSKVACAANAGGYASTAIAALGAQAIYMDVQADTHCIDANAVDLAIQHGADCIVATHLFGLAIPEISRIAETCRAAGVALLEDCAQAHAALRDNKLVGTFGDIACFSFYPTKNLGALGDGGAVITNSVELAQNVLELRQYGWSEKYQVTRGGGRNSRLDELQAALLSSFLPLLASWNQARREIAQRYHSEISHPLIQLPSHHGDSYVAHLFVVQCAHRDALRAYLLEHDTLSDVHYPIPDHQQPAWRNQTSGVSLPVTEQLAASVLTLPCYPEMPARDVSRVIETVNAWSGIE